MSLIKLKKLLCKDKLKNELKTSSLWRCRKKQGKNPLVNYSK